MVPTSILNISTVRLSAMRGVSYFVITTLLLLTAIFWYVASVNAVVSMGYSVSDAMSDKQSVLTELEALEARLVYISRPEELERRAGELGFIPIKNATYLGVPGDAVARR